MAIWISGSPVKINTAHMNQAAADFADLLDSEAENDPEFNNETNVAETAKPPTYAPRDIFWRNNLELCADCAIDTGRIDEYYMVQFELWETVVPADIRNRQLCIGCLEARLGRQLVSTDFIEAPVNYTDDKSERLLNRLGTHFRALDFPITSEEVRKIATERNL